MILNTDNKIYILKISHTDRKTASDYGKKIVKIAACKNLDVKSANLCFEKGDHGKPFLKNYPNFHFNISHSGNFVAAAFSNSPVGVDIEALREVNLKIADRCFSSEEKEYTTDSKTFFYVWTRKEAFIKKTGEGLSRPFASFNTLGNRDIKTFFQDGFTLSVCSENADKFEIVPLTEKEILNSIEALENDSKV